MLFENYNRGIVLMKNKSKTPAELNYDCGNQVMMFKSGAEEMILTNLLILFISVTPNLSLPEREIVFMK